mgnify:CR=1 FL=1
MPPTSIRPGHIIKSALSGTIPVGGVMVTRASVAELHREYKDAIRVAKGDVASKKLQIRQRGMSYQSFSKLVAKARYLGLLERVLPDGSEAPPPSDNPRVLYPAAPGTLGDKLRWLDEGGDVKVGPNYYSLTAKGRGETVAWDDLNTAYSDFIFLRERKSEEAPAPPPPAPVIPPFEFPQRPGRRGAQQLVAHLRNLKNLDVDTPEVDQELERLEADLQGWLDQVEEAVSLEDDKEEPNQDRLDRLQEQQTTLEEAVSALGDQDIDEAIDTLGRAFPAGAPRARRAAKEAPPSVSEEREE